ncbi:peptidase [Cytophagales bacterium WSM2-2]|nr:peptidase [Cytophagales bacterium WSM2-2]
MNHYKREVATWIRWLHIYLSMFSFAALLFFAVTGITLNHTEWVEDQQQVEQATGTLPNLPIDEKSELRIVEYFRNRYKITTPLHNFLNEKSECSISFKGPGYAADIFVDAETGKYNITITKSGLVALLNDLHKGRDSGHTWALLIDISAILMILVSLTGFAMIFFLKKKRLSGLLITLTGAVIIILIYYAFV